MLILEKMHKKSIFFEVISKLIILLISEKVNSEDQPKQENMSYYLKTIEELQSALSREQQIRLLYEQELFELQKQSAPLQLDPNLLQGLLRKTSEPLSPISSTPISVSSLSPKQELVKKPLTTNSSLQQNLLLNISQPLLQNSVLSQQHSANGLMNQQHGGNMLNGGQNVLNQSQNVLNAVFGQQNQVSQAVRLANMNLAFSNPQQQRDSAMATTNAPMNSSMTASLSTNLLLNGQPQLTDQGNKNLNALFEAIRQLENANINGQRLNNNTPVTSQQQNGPTDLLVR